MKTEDRRTCPSCGNELSGAMEFCPVCMLRKGLAGGIESGESSFEEAVKPTPKRVAQQFEHYELVKGEDGTPIELGRGAMGVTYKAFDVDLAIGVNTTAEATAIRIEYQSMSAKQITAPTITFALVSIIPRIQRSLSRLDDSSLLRPIHSPFILSGGLIRLRTRRVTLVGRGGVARSGRVARSGMMLVFGHCLLLMYCRVVFDALLQGFFMHFFPRFIAHVFTVVGIRPL